jgi:hypothetical protein
VDERQRAVLSARVMERLAEHTQIISKQDLPYRAVEEAQRMVNDWLSRVLQDQHPAILAAGRVALLEGSLRDWPERLLQDAQPAPAEAAALRHSLVEAVPPDAELAMPTQAIEFFSFRRTAGAVWCWSQRVAAALRRWPAHRQASR